jgi:hypothetical protein
MAVLGRIAVSRCASKEVSMTRGRAAIAAVMVAVAMALAGAGVSHTDQAKDNPPVASGGSPASTPRLHTSGQEEAGSEMSTF